MKFEDNLIELRKKAGLSQEQLAEKLNVTRQTISKWELGQTKPDVDKLREMSNIFGVDVGSMISNEIPNTKEEVPKEKVTNVEIKPKKEKNRRFILYIVILLLIGSVSLLSYRFINYRVEHKEERQSIFERLFNFESPFSIFGNLHNDIRTSSFNNSFEIYAGNVSGNLLENHMTNLITSNKKNANHQISLIFDGVNYGNDNEKISEIKNSLGQWQKYDLSFNYDTDGYINEFVVVSQ